jgi:hypothetical protein
MSFKNKLQEYCQKNKLGFPTYSTQRCGGSNHKPLFESTLTLNEKLFVGVKSSSKKEAEQNVAELCYSILFSSLKPEEIHPSKPFIVYIDLENKPNVVTEFLEKFSSTNISRHDRLLDDHLDRRLCLYRHNLLIGGCCL